MNQIPIWGDAVPAARASIPSLSKSRVTAGLQCLKRLYLECYARDTRDPIDDSRQALFAAGREVGEVARGRFPNGALMLDDPQRHEDAARETREAMACPGIPAIYEAAFTFLLTHQAALIPTLGDRIRYSHTRHHRQNQQ